MRVILYGYFGQFSNNEGLFNIAFYESICSRYSCRYARAVDDFYPAFADKLSNISNSMKVLANITLVLDETLLLHSSWQPVKDDHQAVFLQFMNILYNIR